MRRDLFDRIIEVLDENKVTPISEPVAGGSFLRVYSQGFSLPNGMVITREFIKKKKASLVIPVTKEDNLVFVIQPIALSKEGSLIEFPAGYVDGDENTNQAGIRELSEETGYTPQTIVPLGSHYQDPGSIKEEVSIYLATGCEKTQNQKLDRDEHISVIEVPYNDAIELMEMGYIKDANTLIALLKYQNLLNSVNTTKKHFK